jgi:hypothetical protein
LKRGYKSRKKTAGRSNLRRTRSTTNGGKISLGKILSSRKRMGKWPRNAWWGGLGCQQHRCILSVLGSRGRHTNGNHTRSRNCLRIEPIRMQI